MRNRPGLGETVAPKRMARGERPRARPALWEADAERRDTDGNVCDVQAKCPTGRELDSMSPMGRVRDLPLALLRRVLAR